MKVKIFVSRWYGELEEKVNSWLVERDESINIVDIKLVKEDEMFVIMIQYKEKKIENFSFNYSESD